MKNRRAELEQDITGSAQGMKYSRAITMKIRDQNWRLEWKEENKEGGKVYTKVPIRFDRQEEEQQQDEKDANADATEGDETENTGSAVGKLGRGQPGHRGLCRP